MNGPPYPAFDGSQLCAQTDPELFHPPTGFVAPEAKKVCGRCPWLDECREWAIWNDVKGIWGGTGTRWRLVERQRRGIPSPYEEHNVQLAEAIAAANPGLVASELALELGCNEKTVQRHRAALRAGEAA